MPTGAPKALPPQSENAALGSGFVYDKQGHIVTNGHVVGNAKIVDVTFVDGNRYTAKVVASDIYSGYRSYTNFAEYYSAASAAIIFSQTTYNW
jgi:S1-C subfamily serine protease